MDINEELVTRLLKIVDAGLAAGQRSIPIIGDLCVEAAVCLAMGMPHGDRPTCVSPFLRHLKTKLNDLRWTSGQARAAGLRRLAIAQLGSADMLDENEFMRRVVKYVISTTVPLAIGSAKVIAMEDDAALIEAEIIGLRDEVLLAYSTYSIERNSIGYVAAKIIRAAESAVITHLDKDLSIFAEGIVQILADMNVPGCKFLHLAPEVPG